MKTYKRLSLKKRGLSNQLVPYSLKKKHSPSLMQNQYRHWSCVLDPAIALSHYGVLISESIGKEVELWVVREFLNIISDADFYSHRPELIVPKKVKPQSSNVTAEVIWSLREWEKARQRKDLSQLGLHWLGDNLQESFLPKNKHPEFFNRWENLANALDKRIEQKSENSDVLNSAFRDTVALTSSLESAFILTYQLPDEVSPSIVKVLENWGIPCQVSSKRDPTIAMERQHFRQLIIGTGLGKLLLAGVNLVVLHLAIPSIPISSKPNTNSKLPNSEPNYVGELKQESYFWSKVKGFWYYL